MSKSKVETNPKVSIVPLDEKWFKQAKVSDTNRNHLLNSMKNLENGRDTTPCFKLYGSTEKSLGEDFLNSIDWKAIDVPLGWKEYEYDRLENKWAPQGGYRPWSELSEIFHLYQERLADCIVNNEVLDRVKKRYSTISCHMLSVDSALAKLLADEKIYDRAAGCRDFALKKTDKIAQQHAIADFRSGLASAFFMYTFSRYYKNKPRIFFPGPYASMLDQARFIVPFLEAIQNDIRSKRSKSSLVQHADKLGFDECFNIMTEEVLNWKSSHANQNDWIFVYVQGDFEKMDTTTGSNQYTGIFIPCIASAFHYAENSNPYDLLSKSMLLTTTMPIASPEGMMVGEHGTGSGLENTNIGEGCSNDYYQEETVDIMKRNNTDQLEWELVNRRVNGDDSEFMFALRGRENLTKFSDLIQKSAEEAASECGFRINEKWRIDTNFGLFCQNCFYWDEKANAIKWFYPSALILNSIVNPEHEYTPAQWDKDYRDLDICEKLDNGRYLPYYKDLVKYVDNGMKFRLLGKSETETSRILSKYDRYRALQTLGERYNKEDWSPSKSPTINLILELRSSQS